MVRKLRILVITYLPWRNDVSVGNSYSNIFKGMEDRIEFAHIYFRDDAPDNALVHRYFHISEKGLARSIWNRQYVGREFCLENSQGGRKREFSSRYNRLRKLRWELFLLGRDMIGRMGKWKSNGLDAFVLDFKPDLIFGTLGYVPVVNQMMIYLKTKFDIPLVTYPWDDYYSWKRISFSPFYWIRYLSERRLIRRCAQASEYLYTITEKMRNEYEAFFQKECRILYKGYLFDEENKPEIHASVNEPIHLIFMGNIGNGRWKVLAKIAQAITRINIESPKAFFMDVYTLSPVDDKISGLLNIDGVSKLNKPVPNEQVLATQRSADILIHVEPTNRADKSFFRLSFSTKLVDYFYCGRCIMAFGGNTASMDYLKSKDAAIVEENMEGIENTLRRVAESPAVIGQYAEKAWKCGRDNHDIKKIQERLYNDFIEVANLK
ncbi:glycosyltransferase family protein [Phocaeicola sartorii]|uniref:Glycosyltransferase family 1 protein n=1 Tax=Phocaeicola sartorii TaxID=671267 RepID=R9IBY2_9BACT|nr:glycosyltransferase family 1 protein [Phocaeicola sartorii]EOS14907.1 hypothetical protein C802_00924 [Phocaeicola sartorii]MCR1846678.1 glycosyltransferase family 1 protein [Phocaeicola sartorii]NUL01307.1 glycosyltransferase family 1 protein [Phocaeicola sartorii]